MVGSTHVLGPQPPILSVMNTNWDSRSSDYTPHAATGADDAIMISSSQLDLEKELLEISHGVAPRPVWFYAPLFRKSFNQT